MFRRYRSTLLLFSLFLSAAILPLRSAYASDYPELKEKIDSELQAELYQSLSRLGLQKAIAEGRLAVALVDISELRNPRVAAVNGDQMMYAASLPKIAILFGLYKRVEEGQLMFTRDLRFLAEMMVRYSSNPAASRLYHRIGPDYIGRLLIDPQYKLYEVEEGGGLWIGKEYGKQAAWKREPIRHLSHAATAMKVARFYYLLETGRLVAPALAASMKQVMARPGLDHKFVKGLQSYCGHPIAMFRKSGSWQQYHSDSAVVLRGGSPYIAVALTEDSNGSRWLEEIIVALDQLVVQDGPEFYNCQGASALAASTGS